MLILRYIFSTLCGVELLEYLIKGNIAQYDLISSHPGGQVLLEKGRIELILGQFQP